MNFGVTVDTRGWNRALTNYAAATKKDLPYVLNRAMGGWLIHASRSVAKGAKASIEAITGLDWWWKYVQKVINQREGYMLKSRIKARGTMARIGYTDTPTGRHVEGRRSMSVYQQAGMRRGDRGRVAKQIIRRRVATVGSLRAMLGRLSLAFNSASGREIYFRGDLYQRHTKNRIEKMMQNANVIPAKIGRMVAEFTLPYKPKPRETGEGSVEQRGAEKAALCEAAMKRALPAAVADMNGYVARKLEQRAREFSRAT